MGKDFWESITEWMHERVSSPILSTFTAMWVVCNYKVVIVLISENKYLDRFTYLDSYADMDGYFLHRLALPILLTAAYLRFYPILRNYVYDYWSELQAEMDNIKVKNFKKKTLSEEEKLELIEANVELKKKYEVDIKERDELIKLLNSQVSSAKSESTVGNSDDIHTIVKLILQKVRAENHIANDELYKFISNLYGINYQSYGVALAKAVADHYIEILGSAENAFVRITEDGEKIIY
jgi:hypothetical protein